MVTVNLEQRAREAIDQMRWAADDYANDNWPEMAKKLTEWADAIAAALSRTHAVDTTGVLRGNADLVPAQHTYLMTQPENNHERR